MKARALTAINIIEPQKFSHRAEGQYLRRPDQARQRTDSVLWRWLKSMQGWSP